MTEDIKLLEAVERYILGQMSEEEKAYFEQLRKSNPEVDQLVVEHSFFLQQVDRYDERKTFRQALHETHTQLLEQGGIKAEPLRGKAKVAYLFHRYKRVGIIAACVAGLTALAINSAVWFSPNPTNRQVELLGRELNNRVDRIEHDNRQLNDKVNNVQSQVNGAPPANTVPAIDYTSGGTGFLVDLKGFVITNWHVIDKAQHVAVTVGGMDLTAEVVYKDESKDIAILRIRDSRFKAPSALPYAFKRSQGELAESIFTLGYPRNDIVYGDGYIAARTGYDGDTLTCQITIPANRGNSGSPILNQNGEIIGMLTGRQTAAEGAVFAINSRFLLSAMNQLQKDDTSFTRKGLPSSTNLKGISRPQQVNKLTDFVYMIKVD